MIKAMGNIKKIILLNLFGLLVFPIFVFGAGRPVLYSAPWCGPCNQLKARLDLNVPGWRDHITIINTDNLSPDEFIPSSIPALYSAAGAPLGNPDSGIKDYMAQQAGKPHPSAGAPFLGVVPSGSMAVKCDPVFGDPKKGYVCYSFDGKKKFTVPPSSTSYTNIVSNPNGSFRAVPVGQKYLIEQAPAMKPEKPRGAITGITELPPVPGDMAEGVECRLIPVAEPYYQCFKDGEPLLVAGKKVVILPEDEDVWQAIKESLAKDKYARFTYDVYKNELIPPTSKPDVVRKDEPAFIDPLKDMPRQYQRSTPSPKPTVVKDEEAPKPKPKSPAMPQPKGSMKK